MTEYLNLTQENLAEEHICCAIADKKHQAGVAAKKAWLVDRLAEGHVFRKLRARGKVFIEYAPLETAWTPVTGDNYLYIYCLWVAGAFKGGGHARDLLGYCLEDARERGKSGVCVVSSKKKRPFLSDGAFMRRHGFVPVDEFDDGHELLALSFDGSTPRFAPSARKGGIAEKGLTIYFGRQCPYTADCVRQVGEHCEANRIPVKFVAVDSLEKAKSLPCLFNNWAVCNKGKFATVHLPNAAQLKRFL